MKTVVKWIAGLFVGGVALFFAMFAGTSGDYPVERLVTDDPTLPSKTVAGI